MVSILPGVRPSVRPKFAFPIARGEDTQNLSRALVQWKQWPLSAEFWQSGSLMTLGLYFLIFHRRLSVIANIGWYQELPSNSIYCKNLWLWYGEIFMTKSRGWCSEKGKRKVHIIELYALFQFKNRRFYVCLPIGWDICFKTSSCSQNSHIEHFWWTGEIFKTKSQGFLVASLTIITS